MTAEERLTLHQNRAAMMSECSMDDWLQSGSGSIALLEIADGLRALLNLIQSIEKRSA